MKPRTLIFLIGVVCYGSLSAQILDDSLSPQRQYQMQFTYEHKGDFLQGALHEGEGVIERITATVPNVEVRLNTSEFVGQNARIFLRLPVTTIGFRSSQRLRVSWQTRDFFASGEVVPGTRTLVFEGPITTPVMQEIFTFKFQAKRSDLLNNARIEPFFEIEPF